MTSISDLNSQMLVNNITDGMDRNSSSSRNGQTADFKSAFANATGQINVQNRDIQTDSNNFSGNSDNSKDNSSADKKSYDKPDVKNEKSASNDNVSKSDTSDKASVKDESKAGTVEEINDTAADAVVDEKEIEAVIQVIDVIIEKTAEILNVDVSEIMQACEDLNISTADLVMPENMNMLAADLMGDGGVESLLTDQNILDTAGELNQMAAEVLEEAGLEPAEISEVMDVIAAGTEEARSAVETDEVPNAESFVQAADVPEDTVPVDNATLNAQNDDNDAADDESNAMSDANKSVKRDDRHDVRHDVHTAGNTQDTVNVQDPGTAEVTSEARPQSYLSNPAEVTEQVIEKIKSQVKDDFSSLELSLHPASLGNVAINLVSKSGVVTAQFSTETEAARAALESQIMVLRQNLEDQGVKIDAVEVTVSSHAFEQNLEQGNDGQSDAEASEQERLRRATRKIDLGDFAGIPEDIDEADAVTAQMMQADGNKMDYKV